MILIVGPDNDPHISRVAARLEELGADYLRFNPEHFPAKCEIIISYERTGRACGLLRYRGREVGLEKITAAWDRRRARPYPAGDLDPEQRWWVEETCTLWLAELWEILDCLWIPNKPLADRDPYRKQEPTDHLIAPPPVLARASPYNKMHQLAVAARMGFRIPRTAICNSPDAFLEFYSRNKGQVVTKAVRALRIYRGGERYSAFTLPVNRREAGRYRAVRYAPVIVQEYVPKQVELRVTVVGSKVFAAEIRSQTNRAARHDWRRDRDIEDASYYKCYNLPPDVELRCVHYVKALGLCFGAIDMILTPRGEYVFLEINPNGQWAWIQDLTGLPIAEAIADLLVGRST